MACTDKTRHVGLREVVAFEQKRRVQGLRERKGGAIADVESRFGVESLSVAVKRFGSGAAAIILTEMSGKSCRAPTPTLPRYAGEGADHAFHPSPANAAR